MNFKKYFQISSAFTYENKDWKKMACLKGRQILGKSQLSTYKRSFYFDQDAFNLKFKDHIKEDVYNKWLEDLILEVEITEVPTQIVKSVPEKPNTITTVNQENTSEEISDDLPF